jgi:glycosyltransferase involved in cell wall biosynthesis
MQVGLLVYGLDRPLAGIGRYALELVRSLRRLNPRPDITLLCAGKADILVSGNGFKHVSLPGSRLLPALMTWGQVAVWRRARELDLDIIHDPTGVSPFGIAQRSTATISTIHDVFAWSLPGYSSLLDTIIYRYWLTSSQAKTDAIITVSSQSRADIEKHLNADPDKIHTIPYGVNSNFHPMEAHEYNQVVEEKFQIRRPYLLYVGALTKRKNLERVLQAFAVAREKCPDLLLVLTGPSSWKQSPIESTINTFDLAKDVYLTGALTDKDLPALYNGALLFIFPSLYEGFGLPVLEAMACGTPVITSNVSSLPEVVGDAAVMVDPYDVEAMAQAICSVAGDQSLRLDLRRLGLARASQFTWECTAKKTVQVYNEVGTY